MSSGGIFVIDNRIPSHFESNSWISSFRRFCKQVAISLDRIVGSSDPEVLVDQESDLSSTKETVLFLGLLVPKDWFFFWTGYYGWFGSVPKQSSHRVLQNLAFEFLLQSTKILDHPLISTSLIQCIASIGNCEQVHTSVLNLIFQQANVAGVGTLSKWRSEICSRCWSAP